MTRAFAGAVTSLVLWLPCAIDAQQGPKTSVVAQVKGDTITLDELERSAGGALTNLALQRQRILEAELERMIAAKVLALESTSRGLTESELLQQEVDSKVGPVSGEEIHAFYVANQQRIKESEENAAAQIAQLLFSQRRQKLYTEYVGRLRTKYGATTSLEPLRVRVDTESGPSRGPRTAAVTIVEFSDFECPYCATLAKTLEEVAKQYNDRVRVVFRQFPLERLHPNAMKAAQASVCAADQDKFWQMHDRLFKGGTLSERGLLQKAADAGVKIPEFQACLSSGQADERVQADMKAGTALGLSSTPSFFINGRPMRGAVPYPEIVKVIEQELKATANRNEPRVR